jgi:cell division protein FtsL
MFRRAIAVLLIAVFVIGCDDSHQPTFGYKRGAMEVGEAPNIEKAPAAKNGDPGVFGAPQPAGGGEKDSAPQRRIIYNGSVDVVVADLDEAIRSIHKLVEEERGFISKSDVRGSVGDHREASFTLRVPSAKFSSIVASIAALGETVSVKSDSQDVTEEFVDLESRIKNKQTEEKRLLEHLQKSTGKLEEILKVEQEITRVRGEIEQMQGRITKLTNLTTLTTITVILRERKGYVPPTTPTYTTSLGRTIAESWSTLIGFFKWIGIVFAAITPWLIIILPAACILYWLIRRQVRREREMAKRESVALLVEEVVDPNQT